METDILVKKARRGDKDALVRLIMLQKDDYYKLAYIYLENREDSLDAIEDMIVILHEKIHTLRKPSSFYSWSKTILVNCCRRILRERRRNFPKEHMEEEVCALNNLERMFEQKKKEFDSMKAPQEMEERLSRALECKCDGGPENEKMHKRKPLMKVAAIIIAVLILGYNFDTMAFYGKRLLGYEDVMNNTLKELSELGKGQEVGKSYRFENGAVVTVDGIMIDENQLLVFYTAEDSGGNADDIITPRLIVRAFSGELQPEGGHGKMNDERTVVKYMDSFKPPRFFEKTIHIILQGGKEVGYEKGEITVKIDRDKAMGASLKKSIGKSISAGKSNIHFESIMASPTQTAIKGSVQSIVELAIDEMRGERMRPKDLEIELVANGKNVQLQSGGMGTDMKGIRFHREFDALPKDLKSLEIRLVRFSSDNDVNEIFELEKGRKEQRFEILGQSIDVHEVYEKSGKTFVRISTDDTTLLSKIHLLADGEEVELSRTFSEELEKTEDARIIKTRTLEFEGTGKECGLHVQGITYSKEFDESFEIPLD